MEGNRKWPVGALVTSWGVYWCALASATLAKPVALAWKLTHQAHGTASISASFDNSVVSVVMKSYEQTVWSMRTSFLEMALWTALPPLMMWGVWVWQRSRVRHLGDAGDARSSRVSQSHAEPYAELAEPRAPFNDASQVGERSRETVDAISGEHQR